MNRADGGKRKGNQVDQVETKIYERTPDAVSFRLRLAVMPFVVNRNDRCRRLSRAETKQVVECPIPRRRMERPAVDMIVFDNACDKGQDRRHDLQQPVP